MEAGPAVAEVLVVEDHLVAGKKEFLSTEQIQKISQAVASAELGTSGEIVPMIVRRSSSVGHLPIYITVVLFSVAIVGLVETKIEWLNAWWGLPILGVFLVCAASGYILSGIDAVQRWLISAVDEETQVWNRAHSEWAFSQIRKTKARTGILLFVSIMERKAIVLADEGIAKHYSAETWNEVVTILSGHLRKGQWTEGFERSIHRCGEILKTHLPAGPDNTNELPDRIIFKD